MIHELLITDPEKTCIHWWDKVDFLKGKTSIPFTRGLNILFGPNGSGKSTILSCMARHLHCEQGFTQVVTGESSRTVYGNDGKYLGGAVPYHDGSPVMYFHPAQQVGISHGEFNWDFGALGLQNTLFSGSDGQTTMFRLNVFGKALGKREFPPVEWKANLSEKRQAVIECMLNGRAPRKRKTPTFLMDEPTRSLDALTEANMWIRFATANNLQVIVATHSPLALYLQKKANIIELVPGYVEDSRRYLDLFTSGEVWDRIKRARKIERNPCPHCNGKRICQTCGGKGRVDWGTEKERDCPTCETSGDCAKCGGSGVNPDPKKQKKR